MDKGRIIKVSGPLVQAEGMHDSKMYDVVRVGNNRLVGEIIRLESDIASIQVYEETEGLKVNDPVFETGAPLVVELGPGLLQNIFDGIQRPLSKLETKGDFIIRGLEMPSLDREKKWKFTPCVKKGDIIEGGDIVGEVQETSLLMHKIMLPPMMKGEVIEIKQGEFTVEQPLGKIRTDKGEMLFYLMQKWPVRLRRPVKNKMPPNQPLVTGQRVIDTMFPVMKGGTACIPGPFGSGKCVPGNTSVLLATGQLKPIEEIYRESQKSGTVIPCKDEEYIVLKRPLKVLSYNDGKIKEGLASVAYKGFTDKIVRIYTDTGRILEVTPSHKLFRFNDNMAVEEIPAINLKEGDYLAVPKTIPLKGRKYKFNIHRIFSEFRSADEQLNKEVNKLLKGMKEKYGSLQQVAHKLRTSYDVFMGFYLGKNHPDLKFIRKVYLENGLSVPCPATIKEEFPSTSCKVPSYLDEKLSLFLGLLMADGMVKGTSVRFYNNQQQILSLYSQLLLTLFGLKPVARQLTTAKSLCVESPVLSQLLLFLQVPETQKSRNPVAPLFLMKSPNKILAQFLKGYFLCEGYFSKDKGEIEISTASRCLSEHLSYILTRLGILCKIRTKKIKGIEYFRVFIRGTTEINKFYRITGGDTSFAKYLLMKEYLDEDIRQYERYDALKISLSFWEKIYNDHGRYYQQLKNAGIEISNHIAGEKISLANLKTFAKITKDAALQKLAFNCLAHIYQDKIVKIETEVYKKPVYDLQIEKYHNFIGGNIPSFLHNTVVLHQIAKWADAQVIVYIGCGERGNEMADILTEFPELKDPFSNRPLMERTVLIANTSNMPVAAREASIYTGITMGEYFRDMGYSVALMADSTSRWAEALREISGRMEEMPGEEGYPAYLGTSVASFYERAGRVICTGREPREGSLSVIGAVSPAGGDMTDPVVQMTLRVVKVFWGLDDRLAYQRHFPAINWLTSYSLYEENIAPFLEKEIGPDFMKNKKEALSILEKESELNEIVRLVGMETLSSQDRLILETARSIKEDFLHQSSFDERDAYTTLKKQYHMLNSILLFHRLASKAIEKGLSIEEVMKMGVREKISQIRYIPADRLTEFDTLNNEISNVFLTEKAQ